MNPHALTHCPGTLEEGYTTYSPACLNAMFGGRKVSHLLPFPSTEQEEALPSLWENRKKISISGVQTKLSLVLDKGVLRLTKAGEQGTYILKPIPKDLKKVTEVPANEHLSMQLARQVYGIPTAKNALVFFADGKPAYLVKRFDVKADGKKWALEDMATLAGLSIDNAGSDFKYDYSYEEIGQLLKRYVPAWRIEMERYFSMVLFNYLFSNGDAHLKNFSIIENEQGDFVLSPAYDLINTRLHVDDSDFALHKGLFSDGFVPEGYHKYDRVSQVHFRTFGKRLGITENRVEKLVQPFLIRQDRVETLIHNSFLDPANKRAYLHLYQTKRNYLLRE